jgi:hypothetical protein
MPKADLGAVFAPPAPASRQPGDRAAGLRGLKLTPPPTSTRTPPPPARGATPTRVEPTGRPRATGPAPVSPDPAERAEVTGEAPASDEPAPAPRAVNASASVAGAVNAPAPASGELNAPAPAAGVLSAPAAGESAAVVAAPTVIAPITVYLPVSLRDRLNAHRHTVAQTLTAVVLDAVEAAHQELDTLLVTYRPAAGAGLFAHRPAPLITRTEPNVQVGLRPSRADLAVLDELVERHQAPNRSVLVEVALDRHLARG